jgi:hypothetical protein
MSEPLWIILAKEGSYRRAAETMLLDDEGATETQMLTVALLALAQTFDHLIEPMPDSSPSPEKGAA